MTENVLRGNGPFSKPISRHFSVSPKSGHIMHTNVVYAQSLHSGRQGPDNWDWLFRGKQGPGPGTSSRYRHFFISCILGPIMVQKLFSIPKASFALEGWCRLKHIEANGEAKTSFNHSGLQGAIIEKWQRTFSAETDHSSNPWVDTFPYLQNQGTLCIQTWFLHNHFTVVARGEIIEMGYFEANTAPVQGPHPVTDIFSYLASLVQLWYQNCFPSQRLHLP